MSLKWLLAASTKPVLWLEMRMVAGVRSSKSFSSFPPEQFLQIKENKNNNIQTLPSKHIAPPSPLLIGSRSNGVPRGRERERGGCTSLCRAWCVCVSICSCFTCVLLMPPPPPPPVMEYSIQPAQSKTHWPSFVWKEGNVTECSARWAAAALPDHPPPPPLLHRGNPCWHNAQRTKLWPPPPAARRSLPLILHR